MTAQVTYIARTYVGISYLSAGGKVSGDCIVTYSDIRGTVAVGDVLTFINAKWQK